MSEEDTSKEPAVEASSPRSQGSNLGASSAIGRRLKSYYDDVASEPVPDRFLSLLEALDAANDKNPFSDRGTR